MNGTNHLCLWRSPPRVSTVFITRKGAESPGSGCIGVIDVLVFFSIWGRWDMEISLVYPSCPLILRCPATPPLPLSHPWPWLWLNTTKGQKNTHPLPAKHTTLLCRHNILLSTPQLCRRNRHFMRKERLYLTTSEWPQYHPISLSRTNSDPTPTYALMTRGQGLNSKFSTVVRHVPTQTVFSFGFFFFYGGCVLADRSPPPSFRVASVSASSSCRVDYT